MRKPGYSNTARIDKRNAHKARHFVRRDGLWLGFASKHKARYGGAVYAQGMSLSAIRELIERNR